MPLRHPAALPWALFAMTLLALPPTASASGTFYVDASNTNCSTATGTIASPYCTISAAAAARGGPGTTLVVKPGIYREQVIVPASGAPGAPFVIQASGLGVVLEGADDLSNVALWSPGPGSAWKAASVTWSMRQVMVDGARLTAAAGSPDSLPPSAFVYVPGAGLFVNLGGDNPGKHLVLAGRRSDGFRLEGRSNVRIEGFEIHRFEDKGIYVVNGSSNDTLTSNAISLDAGQGIGLTGVSNCMVASNVLFDNGDHGIIMLNGVTGTMVQGNEAYGNARPTSRAANGLNLFGCSGNRIVGNRWHNNQDSGVQFTAGSNDNVSIYNLSWNNGDHGFDHLGSTGIVHLGDVAWGNHKDGFSVEGGSPRNQLFNCIATDNGLTTGEYDLWVDSTSAVGLVSNSNLFWNSTAQYPVKWGPVKYLHVTDYAAATGQDTRSLQADPRFAAPAAGDFHLLAGSPAIDCADAGVANWPALDVAGTARRDDPSVANTGLGTPDYADRGAFEFFSDRPPVVTAPDSVRYARNDALDLTITAEDPDGDAITALTADLSAFDGDATFVVSADHRSGRLTGTLPRPGSFPVTFRSSNALSGSRTTVLNVRYRISGINAAPTRDLPGSSAPPLALSGARSSPGSGAVEFRLDLPRPSRTDWSVFDVQGRVLAREQRDDPAGHVTLHWRPDGRAPGSGVYFLRARVEGRTFVRRFVLTG